MFSFQRQVVLVAAVVILSSTLLFGIYTSSLPRSSLRIPYVSQNSVRQFHLLLPATAANANFCRLLLSSTITGYPEPILLGWGGHGLYDGATSHLFKISEALAYLNSLPASRDDDLVLLLDAYDVWLLLPPEVIISRYHKLVEQSNARLGSDGLHGKQHGGADIRHSIFFGADKTCWPDDDRRAACWAVPESTMRSKAFGPDTDTWMVPNRPRWLNSGTIMGPVKDMRAMFNGTMAMVNRVFDEDYEFRTSDQYYFQEVWAAQEVARMKFRNGSVQAPVVGRDQHTGADILGVLPNVPDGQRTEYHITLDYESEIFQTSAAYAEYLVWMSFNRSTPMTSQRLGQRPRIDQLQLPPDIASSAPPFGVGFEAGTIPGKYGWADVMLGLNMVTQGVFPLFHMTGDKSLRDKWWPFLWFHPYGRALLAASNEPSSATDADVIATVSGVKWTGAKAIRNNSMLSRARGGSWSDQGVYLKWQDTCAEHENELFI